MIRNPILSGFHPDPSIIRVDDAYYMVNSSFEWLPAIPIYRSYDLKHWQLMSHAITHDIGLQGIHSACGVWAPALSYCPKNKLFYISFSIVWGFDNNNFDTENYVIHATEPEGKWSKPIYLSSSGFDPSIFHDPNGNSYVVSLEWEFRQGYTHPGKIVIQEFSLQTHTLVGEVTILSCGATTRGCAEGPHIYYRNGYYYLIIAEGGTGYGHCVTISRSESVRGPYLPAPQNPLLTSYRENFNEIGVGNSAKPWRYAHGRYLQKAGHGMLVETCEGETYCVFLCSRPIGKENSSVLGRETAIQKCRWENDWVYLDSNDILAEEYTPPPKIKTALSNGNYPPQEGECFDDFSQSLPLYYYCPRYLLSEDWVKLTGDGLVLRGQGSLFSRYKKSLVARKSNSFSYTVHTKIQCQPENHLQMAGLTHYYNHNNFYYLRVYQSESLEGITLGIMEAKQGVRKEHLDTRVKLQDFQVLYLRGDVENEKLQYFYSYDNQNFQKIGQALDMCILSDEFAGGFTGSFVGLTATDLSNNTWQARFSHLSYNILTM